MTGVQTCALDRKSTRLNSSHTIISYAVFCLKKTQTPHPRLSGPYQPAKPPAPLPTRARPGARLVDGGKAGPVPLPLAGSRVGFFFFNDTAATEIYTLSLHDALPI